MAPLYLTWRYESRGNSRSLRCMYVSWMTRLLFNAVLFSLQCKEGGFPHDLWLSVSADNVSVYKRGEPKPLETFQYEHITFFGASQLCTYKIIVDEREMFFETPMVRQLIIELLLSMDY